MKMLKMLAMAAACVLGTAFAAAESRPAITHEDLWLMPRISTPVISPDGSLAVIVLTEPEYDANNQKTDLWIVPTDGSRPARRLTQSVAAESQPSFSPDGRQLAFVAKREGDTVAQIYLLDLADGGEARRLTTLSTGARLPRFSPDGKQLLFQSDVYPNTRDDAENIAAAKAVNDRKYKVRSYEGFPIRIWDRWLDERQVHLFVVDVASGTSSDLIAGSELVAMPGFSGRIELNQPSLDPVWSADGKTIVFVASTNFNAAAHAETHIDLFALNVADRSIRRLTGDGKSLQGDSYAKPQFSADGRSLHALVSPLADKLYTSTRIDSFQWPQMTRQSRMTAAGTRSVDTFALTPSRDDIYFLSEDAGTIQLDRVTGDGSSSTRVSRLPRGMYSDLQIGGRAGKAIAIALYQSVAEPAELVRVDLADGRHQALTRFSVAKAAALDLAPVENFWSDSPRGVKVHNLLLRPPGFDPSKKYPLLVLMHGGPHGMWRDTFFLRWNYHLLAAPGYVVLMTNFTGSTGFGEGFAQAIQGDPFKTPADEINAAADAAIAKYDFIDGSRQCAGGASYGGHLANWLQGTTTRYRCLISHAGLINLESQWGTSDSIYGREVSNGGPVWEQAEVWREQNPIRLAAKFKTPTLVTVGELDFRVPMNNSLEYWSVLQRLQIPSRLLVYPTEDHWIVDGENSRHFYGELTAWLQRWLQPARTATTTTP